MLSKRKKLKQELHKLKMFKNELPRLIDCSEVFGDMTYKKEYILEINKQIEKIENELKNKTYENRIY